jgi:hypothetical protein
MQSSAAKVRHLSSPSPKKSLEKWKLHLSLYDKPIGHQAEAGFVFTMPMPCQMTDWGSVYS